MARPFGRLSLLSREPKGRRLRPSKEFLPISRILFNSLGSKLTLSNADTASPGRSAAQLCFLTKTPSPRTAILTKPCPETFAVAAPIRAFGPPFTAPLKSKRSGVRNERCYENGAAGFPENRRRNQRRLSAESLSPGLGPCARRPIIEPACGVECIRSHRQQ